MVSWLHGTKLSLGQALAWKAKPTSSPLVAGGDGRPTGTASEERGTELHCRHRDAGGGGGTAPWSRDSHKSQQRHLNPAPEAPCAESRRSWGGGPTRVWGCPMTHGCFRHANTPSGIPAGKAEAIPKAVPGRSQGTGSHLRGGGRRPRSGGTGCSCPDPELGFPSPCSKPRPKGTGPESSAQGVIAQRLSATGS